MHFKVGNGSRILFWHDVWCGMQPLKDHFSDLFRMARRKDATVNQVVVWNGDQCHWNMTFSRDPNDWEEESVLSLLALLDGSKVDLASNDMILWPHDSTKKFTIKIFIKISKGLSVIDFPADAIWKSKAPLKACFLAWAATKVKVPTEEMLKRRNFKLASRCPMCLREEESVDHLFIHCTWVSGLWYLSFSLLGVNWVQPLTIKNVLMSWTRKINRGWLLGIWKMIPLAIWWSTWKERNQRIFAGKARSYQDFKLYFLRTLYS